MAELLSVQIPRGHGAGGYAKFHKLPDGNSTPIMGGSTAVKYTQATINALNHARIRSVNHYLFIFF